MSNKYLCLTCSEVFDKEELKGKYGQYECPQGIHHDVIALEEACDIVNAWMKEREEVDEWTR